MSTDNDKIKKINIELNAAKLALVSKATATREPHTNENQSNNAEDDIQLLVSQEKIIEPPFDLYSLATMQENSSEMGPAIDAMEVGIAGWGWLLEPRLDLQKSDEFTKSNAEKERVRLVNFFEYASMDDDYNTFRGKQVRDYETVGSSCIEIIRGSDGEIQGWEHIPSCQIYLGKQDSETTMISVPILELQLDKSVQITYVDRYKRLRLYCQKRQTRRADMSITVGAKAVWYKEFGDPRKIHKRTGAILEKAQEIEKATQEGNLANELVYFKQYSPRTPYGLPRYIGNLFAIYGTRKAELINFNTFTNNNIPSMVVCVSNGQLTEGSVKRISTFVESHIQGNDNYSKFLILEAEGDVEGEDGGQVKIDIKPLTGEQHKDALFQKYSDNNKDSIRRAWRLPPILVGRADEYTRATADTGKRIGDEQVFAPQREKWDKWVNRVLFPAMGVRYWVFKSNTPNTTDNSELVKLLSSSEKTGGMTPRIARIALEQMFGKTLPDFPEDYPADVPFSLTMAEAVKNMADPAEPGQQVTALKSLLADEDEVEVDSAIEYLMSIQTVLEKRWAKRLKDADE